MSAFVKIQVPSAVMANLRGYPHLAELADDWASSLPEQVAALSLEWQLELSGEQLTGGFWSVLLGAYDVSGAEMVLKLCADPVRLAAEAAALASWLSGPAVDLLAQTSGALLLRRVRPGTELELGPIQLAQLLEELKCSAENEALIDWRERLPNTMSRIPALAQTAGVELTLDVEALGAQVLTGGAGRPLVVLHGDLQSGNILDSDGEAIVIDPYGLAGPWELDVANCAVNHDWNGVGVCDRVRTLAELTGADPSLTLAYARLYALLDGCYHAANHTPHAHRSAALLAFALHDGAKN